MACRWRGRNVAPQGPGPRNRMWVFGQGRAIDIGIDLKRRIQAGKRLAQIRAFPARLWGFGDVPVIFGLAVQLDGPERGDAAAGWPGPRARLVEECPRRAQGLRRAGGG